MRTQTSKGEERLSAQFDHKAIESKWQKAWEETGLYQPDIKRSKNSFYNLMMFPYPSALGLHVGNIYAFVGSDIYGRLKRMQGFDVFEPIGLDGFGIHSENFALKVGKHPMDLSKKTENNIYAQLHTIGNGFAWSHKLETYVSDYYKWTQWIFIQLFKKGLAYRAKASVNWCPSCLTVLADEQVVNKSQESRVKSQKNNQLDSRIWRLETIFVCERCGTEVEKRKLEQWFFRITNYAEKLLSGLEKIDWSEKVKVAQRNWLGKSEGLLLKFKSDIENNTLVEVFTTRPDTLYGVTFMALAPEHPQVTKILDKSKGLLKRQIQKYVADSLKKVQEVRKVSEVRKEETGEEPVKTGIKTGFHCINPATGKRVPVFIADYVMMTYGTGAVMGVPAHDQRDYLFAKKFGIDIVEVIHPAGPVQKTLNFKFQISNFKKSATRSTDQLSQQAFTDYGVLINSEQFNGLNSQEAIGAITNFAVKKGFGTKKVMWHLRDWIISRQRYWGPPIPIIYCRRCWENREAVSGNEAGIEKGLRQTAQSNVPVASDATSPTNETGLVTEKRHTLREGVDYAIIDGKEYWIHPVPESDLPVELPYIENFKPTGTGVSPLASDPNFVKVKCPACGSEARRETDVSDTFLDSAWYFLRYPSVGLDAGPVSSFPPASAQSSQPSQPSQSSKPFDLRAVGSPSHSSLSLRAHPSESKTSRATRKSGFPWNRKITRRWLPVDMYIGGAEHSVLHLLYSRFLWKAFYDFGYFPARGWSSSGWEEPFSKFRAHGLLISEGAKMSKSKGNVVLPDPYIAKYGADTLRTYLMFCGRFDQGGDFRDTGIEGMHRFLKRVWRLVTGLARVGYGNEARIEKGKAVRLKTEKRQTLNETDIVTDERLTMNDLYLMHKTIKKVTEDIENLRYNTAISAIMEWVNALEESNATIDNSQLTTDKKNKSNVKGQVSNVNLEEVQVLLKLLAPFAPFMTEELWQRLEAAKVSKGTKETKASDTSDTFDTFDTFDSIHIHPWPKYDQKLATSSKIELVVEVNGKVRDRVVVDRGIEKEDVQKLALDLENTRKYLAGKVPKKAIFIKDRLINFVV